MEGRCMILHIMGANMYTRDFCIFLNDNFSEKKFIFVNRLKRNSSKMREYFPIEGNGVISVISPISLKFIREAYRSDAIIFHALFNFKYVVFFALQPWLLKKCNWVIWGGDIYSHVKTDKSFIDRVSERLKKIIASRIRYATTLARKDLDLFTEWYGFKGEHFETKYPSPVTRESIDVILGERRKEKSKKAGTTVNIMIGNSATETNQHFQALDWIARFKEEDIKVFLPLSYGAIENYVEYGDRVADYAEEKLGKEKIVPIRERMDGSKYTELISRMDVGIFNCNRQQAMGNITILFSAGAKIYIRKDTAMWSNYISRGNIVHDVETIPELSFSEFWIEDEDARNENYEIIKENTSIEINKKRWGKIFDTMLFRKKPWLFGR